MMKRLKKLIKQQLKSTGEKYWEAAGFSTYVDWCGIFVWWIIKENGFYKYMAQGKDPFYVPNVVAWAKKHGLLISLAKAKPCDIIVYDFNRNKVGDHIGFLWKSGKKSFKAIEGNTGGGHGKVLKRTRYPEQVLCCIRLHKK